MLRQIGGKHGHHSDHGVLRLHMRGMRHQQMSNTSKILGTTRHEIEVGVDMLRELEQEKQHNSQLVSLSKATSS